MDRKPVSVSHLTARIKGALTDQFSNVLVVGEVSNFRPAASGHYYFSLKDESALLNSVLFKGKQRGLDFQLEDGLQIVAEGSLSVYPPRGSYQLVIEKCTLFGQGSLMETFERLKKKLKAEGLFNSRNKKPLPTLPKKIAIITSPTGAAIRDILNVIGRRNPLVEVLVVPCLVQGERAAAQIMKAIELINRHPDFDLILLARGGGSLEDLWAFNDEKLARTIFESKLPVVSAIGHEVDFTISDFVADLRAPTPSAAAELIVADHQTLHRQVDQLGRRLKSRVQNQLREWRLRLDGIRPSQLQRTLNIENYLMRLDQNHKALLYSSSQILTFFRTQLQKYKSVVIRHNPQNLLTEKRGGLNQLGFRLNHHTKGIVQNKRNQLHQLGSQMNALSPLNVLERGYARVYLDKGVGVSSVKDVQAKDQIKVQVRDGEFGATVQ